MKQFVEEAPGTNQLFSVPRLVVLSPQVFSPPPPLDALWLVVVPPADASCAAQVFSPPPLDASPPPLDLRLVVVPPADAPYAAQVFS